MRQVSPDCPTESPPMNHLGKPDAGDLPVQFVERDGDGMDRAIATVPSAFLRLKLRWSTGVDRYVG